MFKVPRRNRQSKHQPYMPPAPAQPKTRYASQQAAEHAIKELQKYQLDLELRAYRSSTDGGWYLTRQLLPES